MKNLMTHLDKYAMLIVKTGVNVQSGDLVQLDISVNQAALARLIVKKAYAAGARQVVLKWTDDTILREQVENMEIEELRTVPEYKQAEMDDLVAQRISRISVVSQDPGVFAGIPTERIEAYQQYDRKLLFGLRQVAAANKISWTVVAAAEGPWAAKVFPELAESEQVDALWDAIFKATKVYEADPVEAWRLHEKTLQEKATMMNQEQFKALHYQAPGTDLTIGLPENHVWDSARSINEKGFEFMANMPTEEIFTAPDRRVVDGVVASTKPLAYAGQVITGISLTFKEGAIIDVKAEQGEEVLKALVEMDEGSKYLGEVALVPDPSPISQSGIIFYSTLFDENASNHLAIGNAYAFSIADGVEMSEKELGEHGLNRSKNHVDFMIGSDRMNIDGIRQDGSRIAIFRNGDWA
ncbi:aminopeptidase [Enterococcus hulanensis]|uniref:Aminopeptidase n=1 Tax=Enterococcus hulanensis TaxID=2559929 RepID=A0ABU3F2Z7_9ENTE|nr:aminopeptidase [Enterococcus hulanensis]MDT2601499.1 aminopeptidase [Enterococcus hulanensis]MDT2610958.1 aminopeptidase [Enterococcus hulanensis]MDT2618363.1 aminopeptidase [Enterococcus hulanensis]MDT2629434.1 aminopeptidase [Enterococcus hulanensis]MDT2656996.1 aminopeptidase [Enterococcus hulanensis]